MPATVLSLESDTDDEFGDVDDTDLILAESNTSNIRNNMKRPNKVPEKHSLPVKRLKPSQETDCVTIAQRILQDTWGFPKFRLKQELAIKRLISRGSAVVIFPTGGGKSLVYQIPALAFDAYDIQCGHRPGGGVTLVVSPLISLMKVRTGC